jgi:hypothetical protein
MNVPKSLRTPRLKALLKADAACIALVAAAHYSLPERGDGALPEVPKGPMPDLKPPTSSTDAVVEGVLKMTVEDGISAVIFFAII